MSGPQKALYTREQEREAGHRPPLSGASCQARGGEVFRGTFYDGEDAVSVKTRAWGIGPADLRQALGLSCQWLPRRKPLLLMP